jgi:hypothetical protein
MREYGWSISSAIRRASSPRTTASANSPTSARQRARLAREITDEPAVVVGQGAEDKDTATRERVVEHRPPLAFGEPADVLALEEMPEI